MSSPNSAGSGSVTPDAEPSTASMTPSSLQGLQHEDEERLLDAIDKLRALDIETMAKPPQLVVCGGQSTGKSSVLEAICDIPFPRGESLCTRFATEIRLRRAKVPYIHVSIEPFAKREKADIDRLRAFGQDLDSFADFARVVEYAKELMGLKASGTGSKNTFSRDKLCVEFHGPDKQPLTLVDLPGLIHATNDTQDATDPELVSALIDEYLSNPSSIMLPVLTAETDWENQSIVQRVKAVDPSGERTLGIITKLDKVKRGSLQESNWLKLAENKTKALKLGWHVLRNIDSAEIARPLTRQERDRQELSFFASTPFKKSHQTKLGVGIGDLRDRLSRILLDASRSSIKPLHEKLQAGITERQSELSKLSDGRPTVEQQRSYLIQISEKFSRLCRAAVDGNYSDENFFGRDDDEDVRLCSIILGLHEDFARQLWTRGAKYWVENEDDSSTDKARLEAEESGVIYLPREDLLDMVGKIIRENRGLDLFGQTNKEVIRKLFIEFSEPWQDLAAQHIDEVVNAIKDFVAQLLAHVTNPYTAANLQALWLEARLQADADAGHAELQKLLAVHKRYALTWRVNEASGAHAPWETGPSADATADRATKARCEADLAMRSMSSYYLIARDSFVDNVPHLAIWSPIVCALQEAFSPAQVSLLSDEQVHALAHEPEADVERRALLQHEVAALKDVHAEFAYQLHAKRTGTTSRRAPLARARTPKPAAPPLLTASPTSPQSSIGGSRSPHSVATASTVPTSRSVSPLAPAPAKQGRSNVGLWDEQTELLEPRVKLSFRPAIETAS